MSLAHSADQTALVAMTTRLQPAGHHTLRAPPPEDGERCCKLAPSGVEHKYFMSCARVLPRLRSITPHYENVTLANVPRSAVK
jgi:hypothetical protein